MSEEERQAIEELKSLSPSENAIFTVLNLIEKQQIELIETKEHNRQLSKEIEKKDKIIDLIAEQLAGLAIFDIEKDEPLILGDKEDVKQYFKEKVEG